MTTIGHRRCHGNPARAHAAQITPSGVVAGYPLGYIRIMPETTAPTIVIVGGVAGGMSAATRLRRLSATASIVVLERGDHVSFANCGLPYYVGGLITDREALLLQTPESLASRFDLDVRVRSEVVAIDSAPRTVTVRAADGSEYHQSYDHLVLSPGARPFVPPVPGVERALTLRDVADVDRLAAATSQAASAVIVGGGFIGLELAENLERRGVSVTIVELAPQVLPPLDPEMAAPVVDELRKHGVQVETGRQVARLTESTAVLDDGREIPADLVIMAIGVRPETTLAASAGVTVGPRGGILVDDDLRTDVPGIYALGDAAEKRDGLTGEQALVPLANLANRHGRHVADVILGAGIERTVRRGALGTAVVGVFDLAVAATGANEKRLRAAGRPYTAIHTHPANHAGYYPGAEGMSLKLLVDPGTDEILGAQAVGGAGVDKRIDVLATAIAAGVRASALADLELAYAPQFGSAKDPVNMLGYVADNLRSGRTRSIQWHELDAVLQGGGQLVDVRTPGEFAAGAIPGAVNIPLDDLRARAHEITARDVVVHCQVGQRGHTAARLLAEITDAEVRNLDGGYRTWLAGRTATSTP